jgi:hypothetical protein
MYVVFLYTMMWNLSLTLALREENKVGVLRGIFGPRK